MYTPNEWTVIRQGLDLVTITGKNAKDLAALQVKVEKDIQKSTAKKEKELQKIIKTEKAKKQIFLYIYNKLLALHREVGSH